jgi:predicted secreted protein
MGTNTEKGKTYLLSRSDDSGSTFLTVGGVRAKSSNGDNPVTDTTSQSTVGDIAEASNDGYETVTLNCSGVMDTRTNSGAVSPSSTLEANAHSGDRTDYLKLEAADGSGWKGLFNITNFSKNAEQQGQVEFSATFQACEGVTFTPAP